MSYTARRGPRLNPDQHGSRVCEECGDHFVTLGALHTHIQRIHRMQARAICSRCNAGFQTIYFLYKHVRSEHPDDERMRCGVCFREYNTRDRLSAHIRRSHGPRIHDCRYCNKKFDLVGNLRKHESLHTKTKLYSCHYCMKSFTQPQNLTEHLLVHEPNKCVENKCGLCGIITRDRTGAVEHMQRVHKKVENAPKSGNIYRCHFCRRGFPTRVECDRHSTQIHGREDFSCPICSETFQDPRDGYKHLFAHGNPTTPTRHFCKYCDKSYTLAKKLRAHMRKFHPLENERDTAAQAAKEQIEREILNKPRCSTCGVYFMKTSHLYRHRETLHPDQNKYESAATDNMSKIANRINLCKFCGKDFKRLQDLVMHRLSEHGDENGRKFSLADLKSDKRQKCQFCNSWFLTDMEYEWHKIVMHADRCAPGHVVKSSTAVGSAATPAVGSAATPVAGSTATAATLVAAATLDGESTADDASVDKWSNTFVPVQAAANNTENSGINEQTKIELIQSLASFQLNMYKFPAFSTDKEGDIRTWCPLCNHRPLDTEALDHVASEHYPGKKSDLRMVITDKAIVVTNASDAELDFEESMDGILPIEEPEFRLNFYRISTKNKETNTTTVKKQTWCPMCYETVYEDDIMAHALKHYDSKLSKAENLCMVKSESSISVMNVSAAARYAVEESEKLSEKKKPIKSRRISRNSKTRGFRLNLMRLNVKETQETKYWCEWCNVLLDEEEIKPHGLTHYEKDDLGCLETTQGFTLYNELAAEVDKKESEKMNHLLSVDDTEAARVLCDLQSMTRSSAAPDGQDDSSRDSPDLEQKDTASIASEPKDADEAGVEKTDNEESNQDKSNTKDAGDSEKPKNAKETRKIVADSLAQSMREKKKCVVVVRTTDAGETEVLMTSGDVSDKEENLIQRLIKVGSLNGGETSTAVEKADPDTADTRLDAKEANGQDEQGAQSLTEHVEELQQKANGDDSSTVVEIVQADPDTADTQLDSEETNGPELGAQSLSQHREELQQKAKNVGLVDMALQQIEDKVNNQLSLAKDLPFSCHCCRADFTVYDMLVEHVFAEHYGVMEKLCYCDQCGKQFSRDGDLRKHLMMAHNIGRDNLQCPFCTQTFTVRTHFYAHITAHKDQQTSIEGVEIVHDPTVIMEGDGLNEARETTEAVDQAVYDLSAGNSFQCSECNSEFTTLEEAMKHIIEAHGQESGANINVELDTSLMLPTETSQQLVEMPEAQTTVTQTPENPDTDSDTVTVLVQDPSAGEEPGWTVLSIPSGSADVDFESSNGETDFNAVTIETDLNQASTADNAYSGRISLLKQPLDSAPSGKSTPDLFSENDSQHLLINEDSDALKETMTGSIVAMVDETGTPMSVFVSDMVTPEPVLQLQQSKPNQPVEQAVTKKRGRPRKTPVVDANSTDASAAKKVKLEVTDTPNPDASDIMYKIRQTLAAENLLLPTAPKQVKKRGRPRTVKKDVDGKVQEEQVLPVFVTEAGEIIKTEAIAGQTVTETNENEGYTVVVEATTEDDSSAAAQDTEPKQTIVIETPSKGEATGDPSKPVESYLQVSGNFGDIERLMSLISWFSGKELPSISVQQCTITEPSTSSAQPGIEATVTVVDPGTENTEASNSA